MLAHELGHTLFYRPGSPPTRSRPADRFEEDFCHRFATSLLVPSAAARAAEIDPAGLHALADRFDVSVRVAAWAVARARPDVMVLWLRRAPHPSGSGPDAMRVQWGASERFIAVGESFKSDLARLPPGDHGRSIEMLCLAGRRERVEIEAWRFASWMLAVIRPSGACDAAGPAQLPLF